jgi:hypothetical protein
MNIRIIMAGLWALSTGLITGGYLAVARAQRAQAEEEAELARATRKALEEGKIDLQVPVAAEPEACQAAAPSLREMVAAEKAAPPPPPPAPAGNLEPPGE